jgi:DNA polymerase III delta prime subunit
MVLTAVITWGGNVKRGRSERKVIFLDELDKYLDIVKAEEAAKSVAATGRGAALTHKRVLQELMSFIDSGQDVLVVMACNNFDKLFEGEETHYAALRSRFIEVDFAPFQRTDICGYLRYMNECMRDVERAYCHDLERHLEVLDTNAVAAARHLDHLLVLHTFDYGKIVDDVNNQVPTTTQSAPQSAL